jgi:hypothetical protein
LGEKKRIKRKEKKEMAGVLVFPVLDTPCRLCHMGFS